MLVDRFMIGTEEMWFIKGEIKGVSCELTREKQNVLEQIRVWNSCLPVGGSTALNIFKRVCIL